MEDFGSFTYSSQPHSAPVRSAKKYKDQHSNMNMEATLTLMSDPRVVRGSTFSMARKIAKAKSEMSKSQPLNTNTHSSKPTESTQRSASHHSRPAYRYDVKSFANNEIDVSQYLIAREDQAVEKKTVDNQTDEFHHRPDSPDYVPAKIGVDIGTQVEDVRELFDFEEEVTPILEVIVRKTIEQSLYEVQSEEELLAIEKAARGFRAEKFKEDEFVKEREEQAIRDNKEIINRIAAVKKVREDETATKTVIAGMQMMKQILPDAIELAVVANLNRGIWRKPEEVEAEDVIIPELMDGVIHRMEAISSADAVLDEILFGAEALYQTSPTFVEPAASPEKKIIVTFRPPPADAADDVGDGNVDTNSNSGSSSAPTAAAPFTTLTVMLGPEDSIASVERRVRMEVARLKLAQEEAAASASETAEATDEALAAETEATDEAIAEATDAAVPESKTPMVLPDNSVLAGLRPMLLERLEGYLREKERLNREIAIDAALMNFSLPSIMEFEMIVG